MRELKVRIYRTLAAYMLVYEYIYSTRKSSVCTSLYCLLISDVVETVTFVTETWFKPRD